MTINQEGELMNPEENKRDFMRAIQAKHMRERIF